MTIDEIFSSLSSHMIQGMMVHDQLRNCYLFLGLTGYAVCHEYRYLDETKDYMKLCTYKLEHYNSLIQNGQFQDPGIVPASWFTFTRDQVDRKTREDAMAAAYDEWIDWEEDTKKLYEEYYKALLDMGEIATADFILSYINGVEEELVYAQNERLKKTAMAYDIVSILEEQDAYEKEFRKKIRKLK